MPGQGRDERRCKSGPPAGTRRIAPDALRRNGLLTSYGLSAELPTHTVARWLRETGYRFTTVTLATHARVNVRSGAQPA